MGEHIEFPHRVDGVAEELQAVGHFRLEGKDVNDTSPGAELADLLDDRHPLVAAIGQPFDQQLPLKVLPHLQMKDIPGEILRRRHPAQQGRGGGDQHRVGLFHQGGQGVHAHTIERRGEHPFVERHHLIGGEVGRLGFRHEGAQVVNQFLRRIAVREHDQLRTVLGQLDEVDHRRRKGTVKPLQANHLLVFEKAVEQLEFRKLV